MPGCFCRAGLVLESLANPAGRCVQRAACPTVGVVLAAIVQVYGAGRSRLGQIVFSRGLGGRQMRMQGRLSGLSEGEHGIGIAEFGNCRDPGER